MRKRLLSLLLCMCMVVGMLPASAAAAVDEPEQSDSEMPYLADDESKNELTAFDIEPEDDGIDAQKSDTDIAYPVTGGNIYFNVYSGYITDCDESVTEANIPATINGKAVTSIGIDAFSHCSSLTSVNIPNSVTSIGPYAFQECSGLTNVTIQNGVTYIGHVAFDGCSSLISVNIPNSVTYIGHSAFAHCSGLTSVTIPDGVTSIKENTFFQCSSLASVNIPNSVTSIEFWAFMDCSGLTSINIPNSVTSIGPGAFEHCIGLTSVNIPDSVTSIGWGAFKDCIGLTSVNIPNGVTSIGESAFQGCSRLTSVNIQNGVTSIGESAFQDCIGLTSVNIPNGVTSIENATFSVCSSLTSVNIPNSVTSIGDFAFYGCSRLKDVYYGGSESEWRAITIGSNNGHLTNAIIHYNSTAPEENPSKYKVYCNGGYEEFYDSLENCIARIPSTKYDSQLAHMLIAMSNSVHNAEDISSTFDNFGFKSQRFPLDYITFNIGIKEVGGKTIVLVVVRGTGDPGNDLLGWCSNILDFKPNDKHQHSGFSDAANEIYKCIVNLLGTNDFSNVQFVLTGHSRGAAAANILAARLVDETHSSKNIYAYTFACPDDAVITADKAASYPSIFNINNINDPVSWIPGTIFTKSGEQDGHGVNSHWDKYGKSYWYCPGQNGDDLGEILEPPTSIGELIGMADRFITIHPQNLYLDYLRKLDETNTNENPLRAFKTRQVARTIFSFSAEQRRQVLKEENLEKINGVLSPDSLVLYMSLISVYCPVDVEVYDEEMNLVGRVKNNILSDVTSNKVFISVDDDEKYIYILDDGKYTVNLSGTDTGSMIYTVQNINAKTGETINSQVFECVELESGKLFTSEVNVKNLIATDVQAKMVKLLVLGDSGQPKKMVLSDGTGNEIPLTAPTHPDDTDSSGTDSNGTTDRSETPRRAKATANATTPSDDSHVISIPDDLTGGSLNASPSSAKAGERVTLTATPESGYQLDSLAVTDASGKQVDLSDGGNGTYTFIMPDGKISVSASFRPIAESWQNPFADVAQSDWFYNAVRYVQENGLMSGYSSGLFGVNDPLTRAQLAQILFSKEGTPTVSDSQAFPDVDSGEWYAGAVRWAVSRGVMSGYGSGLFGPNDPITREQLVVTLWRYAGSPASTQALTFSDAGAVSDYARTAMCWAVENGVLTGSGGTLAPQGQATRAQVAQMLMNYLKK